ncbi:restriction endonuclease subunit S [Virgibacillus sp. C22-A2]|uniref:Restriction endonuclease subunit S n=1 Tax=Virgibacillus tibetensis TaxID=3042313 RepID=A0ABU6KK87_9BACI|nr:restriction endonuclease subunit S [Virgibacillus sp. C22-A2]
MVKTIKEVFKINGGNSGLTKRYLYSRRPKESTDAIPVYSGSIGEELSLGYIDNKYLDDLKTFTGPAVVICRKGLAGSMEYVTDELFTVNDDAYVMYVNDEYKESVNLEWASFNLQKLFYQISTSKNGNGTFSKTYAEKQDFDFPYIRNQNEELIMYRQLTYADSLIVKIQERIDDFLSRICMSNEMTEYKVSDVFYLDTGKRITRKTLYNNLNQFIGSENLIPIVSSGAKGNGIFGNATEDWLKNTYKRGRKTVNQSWDPWKNYVGADFIIDSSCVTWNTDGDAGTLFYRDYSFFPTDHCGVLIPKEKYTEKVNLKYFVYSQKYNFKQNSDRGNLHKEQMANLTFMLPDIDTQNKIAEKVDELLDFYNNLTLLRNKIVKLRTTELTL